MKLKNLFIAGAVMLASTFAASRASAVLIYSYTNAVTVNLTVEAQSSSIKTNTKTGVVTVGNPTKMSLNTADMLELLAAEEGSTFAKGDELVLLSDSTGENVAFRVLDKSGNLVVDVSSLFAVSHGETNIVYGSTNTVTGLHSPSGTIVRIFDFSFNDAGAPISQNVQFQLGGVETKKVSDSTPKSGVYTETVSASVSNLIGDGSYKGTGVIVTSGTMDFSSKTTLTQ